MVYRVLLVGNGAREHAVAKKIVEDNGVLYSFMSRENPGIANLSNEYVIDDLNNFECLKNCGFMENIDYAFIGPEAPLAEGIVDYLEDKLHIPTCGPRKSVAKIETSKVFARELLKKHSINGNPNFFVCNNLSMLDTAIDKLGLEVAIKPDGLTGGKGVKVYGDHFQTKEALVKYAEQVLEKHASFLIEEKVIGKEFSLQAFTDGKNLQIMPLVRDYKRAYDNEQGPNTGSMGSYSLPAHNLPFIDEKDMAKAMSILRHTIKAIKEETGIAYKGILYGQFMKNEKGIYLIEFNVRFGDPEAINVLKLLKTGFNTICKSILENNLVEIEFEKRATVCVYVVPKGYPTKPEPNNDLKIPFDLKNELYFASVYRDKQKIRTTTSRALAIVGEGNTLDKAREKAYENVPKIEGKIFYRNDIGQLL